MPNEKTINQAQADTLFCMIADIKENAFCPTHCNMNTTQRLKEAEKRIDYLLKLANGAYEYAKTILR